MADLCRFTNTSPQMLAMVPQPVKAVILLFPLKDDFKKKRDARYAQKLQEVGEGHIDPTVIWIKQTVRVEAYLIRIRISVRVVLILG